MTLKIMFRKQPQIRCVLHNFRKKERNDWKWKRNGTLHVVLALMPNYLLLYENFRSDGGSRPVAFAVSRNALSAGCSTLLLFALCSH